MEEMDDTLGKVKQHLKLSRHRGECKVHLQVGRHPCSSIFSVGTLWHGWLQSQSVSTSCGAEQVWRLILSMHVHLQVTYQPIGKDEVQRIREGDDIEDAEDDQVHGSSGPVGCCRCFCSISCGRRPVEAGSCIKCTAFAP
jgi:hypothetical protein